MPRTKSVPKALPPRPRILLVDDDERNLMAISQVVEPLGDVVAVTSGRDALRELLRGDFALILLDVYMPGIDGYETAQLIRAREQSARIPIIFLSAVNKETEHLLRGYAMGAVDYVFKPVDPVVLKSKIAVFVDLYAMRQQVIEQAEAEQAEREARHRAEGHRLLIERELHQTRLRQASIVEAVPLALYEARCDERRRLLRKFVGGDLAKLIGEDAEDIVSGALSWDERIPDEDYAQVCEQLAEMKAGASLEYRWRRRDGEYLHFLEQLVATDAGGTAFVGTLIDATQQRRLEQQLLQTGKLDAIGQLAGGIAHDFNNLLAAMLGGMSLIERRVTLPEREGEILAQMRHAAEKGVELVRRLMTFGRKQELKPVSIAPGDLCASVSGLVNQTLGGEHPIEWDCTAKYNFLADQGQLELATVNLIINARDAMSDGGTIVVTVSDTPPERVADLGLVGEFLCVRVSDDGVGIPAALIDKVSEPFFTTKTVGKGTGLGLAMVAEFVHQSGGKLRISSAQETGTSVELHLPATTAPAQPATAVLAAGVTLAGKRILVVDDEDAVRTIVAEQLTELGASVTTARHGPEAVELVAAAPAGFDMMLTDFAMPGLNGLQTIREVRAIAAELPVAIMTGHASRELDRSSGEITVLTKPVSLRELEATIGELTSPPTPAKPAARPRKAVAQAIGA